MSSQTKMREFSSKMALHSKKMSLLLRRLKDVAAYLKETWRWISDSLGKKYLTSQGFKVKLKL